MIKYVTKHLHHLKGGTQFACTHRLFMFRLAIFISGTSITANFAVNVLCRKIIKFENKTYNYLQLETEAALPRGHTAPKGFRAPGLRPLGFKSVLFDKTLLSAHSAVFQSGV